MTWSIARRLAALLAAGATVALSTPAPAQQNPIVPMLLCPFGCGNTEGYAVLGNLVARGGDPITLAPQETPGYMYNIRAMTEERRWKNTVFGTEDTIILLGPQGGRPEIKDFLPEPINLPFKLLFGEAFWGQGKYFVSYDTNLKTPADLKGKRIGITTPGSSTDTATRKALAIWNMDPSDVALVPLASSPNILTGMVAKQVDAGVLSPPTNTRARMSGFQELLNLARDGPDYPSVTFGSTQKYLSSSPEVALAFVRAYSRGIHRFKTDQPFALQALAKYLQLNDQAVLDDTWKQFSPIFADVPYVNPQGVQNAIETVAQTVPEASGATPDRFVDSSFVRQLDEGGFYKQLLGA
jgi:ABC-type amino acid transport substrate-binding protein